MLAKRIERAGKTSSLSLRSLAENVGVSQTAINKYEKGLLTPNSTMLIKLAKALDVKVGYFFRTDTLDLKTFEYLRKSTLPIKKLQMIEGKVREQLERRLELESLFPYPPVPDFVLPNGFPETITSMDEIDQVAKTVRDQWQLGMNQLPKLSDVLESKGIRIFEVDESDESKFDGLAATVNGYRIIVISKHWTGDRQRFTMARELGHLILAGRLSSDLNEDRASDRFAGAFLLPDSTIIANLGKHRTCLEWQELLLIKQGYGIAMSVILHRLRDLGVIKPSHYKQLKIEFSKCNWHNNEPQSYPAEEPHHFKGLVFHALAEEYISESKAAELMDMSVNDFYNLRMIEA